MTLGSVFTQFRDNTSLFLFKPQGEDLYAKIRIVAQDAIQPARQLPVDLGKSGVSGGNNNNEQPQPLSLLEQKIARLVDLLKTNTPYLDPQTATIKFRSRSDCLDQSIGSAIDALRVEVQSEQDHENLLCPIYQSLFKKPVTANCKSGHTFEEEAIKEHLKRSDQCPYRDGPITSLTPNHLIKMLADLVRQQEVVPPFKLDWDPATHKPQLAKNCLGSAKALLDEEDFEGALQSCKQAFKYTGLSTDYELLPCIFEKKGARAETALAYLYLAQGQIKEGKPAKESLERALRAFSQCPQLYLPLANLLAQTESPGEGAQLCLRAATQAQENKNPQLATVYLQRAIEIDPTFVEGYMTLAVGTEDPLEKAHLLMKAALHLAETDPALARNLAESSRNGAPMDAYLCLSQLEVMKRAGQHPFSLAEGYEQLFEIYRHYANHKEDLPTEALGHGLADQATGAKAEKKQLRCLEQQIALAPSRARHLKLLEALDRDAPLINALVGYADWLAEHQEQGEAIERLKQALFHEVERKVHDTYGKPSTRVLTKLRNLGIKMGNPLYFNPHSPDEGRSLAYLLGKAYCDEGQTPEGLQSMKTGWEDSQDLHCGLFLASVTPDPKICLSLYHKIAQQAYLEGAFDIVIKCSDKVDSFDSKRLLGEARDRLEFAHQVHTARMLTELGNRLGALEGRVATLGQDLGGFTDRLGHLNSRLGEVGTKVDFTQFRHTHTVPIASSGYANRAAISCLIAINPNCFAVGLTTGHVQLWNLGGLLANARANTSNRILHGSIGLEAPAHQGNVHCLFATPNQLLFSGGADGNTITWDISEPKAPHLVGYPKQDGESTTMAMANDQVLAAGCKDGHLRFHPLDRSNNAPVWPPLEVCNSKQVTLIRSVKPNVLAVLGGDKIAFWDVAARRQVGSLDGPPSSTFLLLSPTMLLNSPADDTVSLFNIQALDAPRPLATCHLPEMGGIRDWTTLNEEMVAIAATAAVQIWYMGPTDTQSGQRVGTLLTTLKSEYSSAGLIARLNSTVLLVAHPDQRQVCIWTL